MLSGCGLLWMGQTYVEFGDPQLYQLQSKPAGNQEGQSGSGVSRGTTWSYLMLIQIVTYSFYNIKETQLYVPYEHS